MSRLVLPPGVSFDEARHQYFDRRGPIPSVTQILERSGLRNYEFSSEEAMERGREVHLITQLWDEGDLGDFDPDYEGYLEAWKRFRVEWGFIPDPELIEFRVYSEIFRYAGSGDRIGHAERLVSVPRRVLLDIKTGPLDDTVGLQTIGYEIPFGKERFLRLGVHLHADGTFRVTIYKDPLDRQVFLSARTIVGWRARMKKESE